MHSIPVEDTAVAALRFASGALGTVVATTASAPGYPRRMTLTGERGSITLTEDGLSEWQVPGIAMPNCARMEAHGAASPDGIPLAPGTSPNWLILRKPSAMPALVPSLWRMAAALWI